MGDALVYGLHIIRIYIYIYTHTMCVEVRLVGWDAKRKAILLGRRPRGSPNALTDQAHIFI